MVIKRLVASMPDVATGNGMAYHSSLTFAGDALHHIERGNHTVFMEPISAPSPRIPGPMTTIAFEQSLSGLLGFRCEQWVSKVPSGQYPVRVDTIGGIQGDAKSVGRFDTLEDIHIVGDLYLLLRGIIKQRIPARPDPLTFWQQPGIRVQDHLIILVAQQR